MAFAHGWHAFIRRPWVLNHPNYKMDPDPKSISEENFVITHLVRGWREGNGARDRSHRGRSGSQFDSDTHLSANLGVMHECRPEGWDGLCR